MRKSNYCPKCLKEYDRTMEYCPYCERSNDFLLEDQKLAKMIWPSWYIQLIIAVVGYMAVNFLGIVAALLVQLLLLNLYQDPLVTSIIYYSGPTSMIINLGLYFFLFVFFIALLWPQIGKIARQFTKLRPLIYGVAYGGLMMVISGLYGVIISLLDIGITDNVNEVAVTSIMSTYPFASLLALVIIGPIVEEIIYRIGLFGLLRRVNRVVAYVVAIIIFGLIHATFDGGDLINELINLPSYMIAGGCLCYIYEKEGFAASTYAHILNNFIGWFFTVFPI